MTRENDKREYKYLSIVEMDKIKETDLKETFANEYKKEVEIVLKSKSNVRNVILAINTWAASVLRYGTDILKWKTDESKSMDRKLL